MQYPKQQNLKKSVIRILDVQGSKTVGTGFVVADHLAVTCAHVVEAAGSGYNQAIHIQYFTDDQQQTAQVLRTGWSPSELDDVAFLQLDALPEGIVPVILGTAEGRNGHEYQSLGFAKFELANYDSRWVKSTLDGVLQEPDKHKHPMLQLKGDEINKGMSGAPVIDTKTDRVVGMISEFDDEKYTRFAWATTADTLGGLYSSLKLWPDEYGPDDLNAYLQYVINDNQTLTLPYMLSTGKKMLLEHVYISLRTSEMNSHEWEAQRPYLDNMTSPRKIPPAATADQDRFMGMHEAVAHYSEPLMLEARNWPGEFSERVQDSFTLAEIIQRHRQVVILGDPGSGKTTLGKWLVLQFARDLQRQKSHVKVCADTVQPGADADEFIDLGPTRLPIFVRIADYALHRWEKERDNKLSIASFISKGLQYEGMQDKPKDLLLEVIGNLAKGYLAQGRALVILDGLDEVGHPGQREAVMQAVQQFIQVHSSKLPGDEVAGNLVLLTSRRIGYHYYPLPDLWHYTVEEMDETAITAFCYDWIHHVAATGELEAIEQAEKLKKAIFDHAHPGVRTLASNPLLLAILAYVYWNSTDSQRTLPTQRVELFQRAANAMYYQREAFWRQIDIKLPKLSRALGEVAYYIHSETTNGLARKGIVYERLEESLGRDRVDDLFEADNQIGGFLIERGQGLYGFLHRAVQEYFAALYLAHDSQHVATKLSDLLLNPTWREVVTLVVGEVSRHRPSRLGEVFAVLLDTPDTAGDFLPRRELLAAAACAECEEVPPGSGKRIAENLLNLYAKYAKDERYDRSSVLRNLIQRAFSDLYRSANSVKKEVENVLCKGAQEGNSEHRYATIDLIIETKWDSPAIAKTLVAVWQNYPDPAASLLMALAEMSDRQPTLFEEEFLPFRRIVISDEPQLWELAMGSDEWRAIIHTLYLPPDAKFTAERINRDSPLTNSLVEALRELPTSESLVKFCQHLMPLARNPGTAQARDAALALSAIGDMSWVKECVENGGEHGRLLRPIAASLSFFLARDLARAHTANHLTKRVPNLDSTRDLAWDLAQTQDPVRAHNLAYRLAFPLAQTYDRTSTPTTTLASHLDLARMPGSPQLLDPTHARTLIRTLARVLDLSLTFDFDLALTPAHDIGLVYEIETLIQEALLKWAADAALVQELDLILATVQTIRERLTGSHEPMIITWTNFITVWQERWSMIPDSPIDEDKGCQSQITIEMLYSLVEGLVSHDDILREQARRLLRAEKSASTLGQHVIEQMAVLAHTHASNPQIGTQLEWALKNITHDMPSWVSEWIAQASRDDCRTTNEMILQSIHRVTPDAFTIIELALPTALSSLNKALLASLSWLVRSGFIPKERQTDLQERLLSWLDQENDSKIRSAIIKVLGHWQEVSELMGKILLHRLNNPRRELDALALYEALARLVQYQPEMLEYVRTILYKECPQPAAASALVRLSVAEVRIESKKAVPSYSSEEAQLRRFRQVASTLLLAKVREVLSDSEHCLTALLDAGVDDDVWDDDYHPILATAIQKIHLEMPSNRSPKLLKSLLGRLQRALEEQNWQERRIALAAVAACAEVMPIALQNASESKLESLLVKCATDAESFTSRRFALTALSYLRKVTPAVVPALVAGCQDVEAVQQAAIDAASRFQSIEGDLLSMLIPYLKSESLSTIYAVARLLGALGTSAAGESAGLRSQIIEALANALKDSKSLQEVYISSENKGKLGDTLYIALLQVTGWVG